MLLHKIKYIYFLVSLSVLLYVILFFGGKFIFENSGSITGLAVAIAVFILFEFFVIFFTDRKNKNMRVRQTINLFLGYKLIRILISILFISIYALIVKVELKLFIGIFLLIYLIFLFFDTVYLVKREKILKNKLKVNDKQLIDKRSNYKDE